MRVQVILGEAPCMATTWVTEYWQLLLLRTLTGVSIGGALPLVYSLLGDLFFAQQVSMLASKESALLCAAGEHASKQRRALFFAQKVSMLFFVQQLWVLLSACCCCCCCCCTAGGCECWLRTRGET